MRSLYFLVVALAVSSCGTGGDKSDETQVDQVFNAEMASQSISTAFPDATGIKIHAVCGPSVGKGLYEDDQFGAFQSDAISEGRLIFFSGADNTSPNVAFRDASGQYLFALADGGEVRILGPNSSTWIVAYPSTGVVETHNLVTKDGQMIDLWTSNKPAISSLGATARVFTSNCSRP